MRLRESWRYIFVVRLIRLRDFKDDAFVLSEVLCVEIILNKLYKSVNDSSLKRGWDHEYRIQAFVTQIIYFLYNIV